MLTDMQYSNGCPVAVKHQQGGGKRGEQAAKLSQGTWNTYISVEIALGWEDFQDVETWPANSLHVGPWLEGREKEVCTTQTQTLNECHIHSKLRHHNCDEVQITEKHESGFLRLYREVTVSIHGQKPEGPWVEMPPMSMNKDAALRYPEAGGAVL